MPSDYRFILYHKHRSSGRTLFLRLGETVCQFKGISASSRLVDSRIGGLQVKDDLSDLLTDAEQRLGMVQGSLELDREFDVSIDDAGTSRHVYLAQFTMIDPPEDQLAEQSGRFIALTDARRLPPIELELLRLAYSIIMDD